jgi:hypothetical protein
MAVPKNRAILHETLRRPIAEKSTIARVFEESRRFFDFNLDTVGVRGSNPLSPIKSWILCGKSKNSRTF